MNQGHIAAKDENSIGLEICGRVLQDGVILANNVDYGVERVGAVLLFEVFMENWVFFVVDDLMPVTQPFPSNSLVDDSNDRSTKTYLMNPKIPHQLLISRRARPNHKTVVSNSGPGSLHD